MSNGIPIILGALVGLFILAIVFVSMFPAFDGIDEEIQSRGLSAEWLEQLATWRTMIWSAPVFGFILVLIYIIIQFFRTKNEGGGVYYG